MLSYQTDVPRPRKGWKKYEESPVYKNDNTLRAYQLEGLNWLTYCWYLKQNSILADEMGLGKTVQSTALLNHLFTRENIQGPFLIVTPLSTIGNWEREIKTWTDMNVVVYHGSTVARNLIVETEFTYRDERGRSVPNIYKFDIILTTYEMAMSGSLHLRPIDWKCVVVDEAHRLKNKSSKISELLKTYHMQHRILLTGTPLQNSIDELWALLNFLEPEKFASEQDFKVRFGSLTSASDVERLQKLLKPLMLRRLKEDVEKSIPVKEETIVEVELTTIQKKWYRSILEKNFAWLKQGASRTNVPQLINVMIELRKCCIHPFLLKGAEEQIMEEYGARSHQEQYQALIQASGKMVLIDKLLRKLKDGGHKVLIFSQMTRCLDIIQDYIRGRGWGFERIDGGVRGDLRQASIDRFSAPDSESFVFLLCTRAGGVGINLTAADTCIIFDSDWNPQNDLQAQSRCHRIGQKKAVQIYRLIMRGTYERDMFDRASMKLGLDKAVLQRMDNSAMGGGSLETYDGGTKLSALSKTEIEGLLKKGAYGAFMDDDASKQFCEEDIDQILERRTQIVRHEVGESQKGSTFSKATFASANAMDVDLNDPDFWDKVKEQAKLEVLDPVDEFESLMIDLPRQRRQVARFGNDDEDAQSDQPHDATDGAWRQEPSSGPSKADLPKPWALGERGRLERHIMSFGFDAFAESLDKFPRRDAEDLQACCRYLIIYCLQKCQTADEELVQDVKNALAEHPDPFYALQRIEEEKEEEERKASAIEAVSEAPKTEGETAVTEKKEEGAPKEPSLTVPAEAKGPNQPPTTRKGPAPRDIVVLRESPFPGASKKQIAEFRSFFAEAPPEYADHVEKRSKNILIRVSMLWQVRHKINPQKGMKMPPIGTAPPVPWWGPDQDLDLLLSVVKHGYQQYDKMKTDPKLCFMSRISADMPAPPPMTEIESSIADPLASTAPSVTPSESKTEVKADVPEAADTPAMDIEDNDSVAETNNELEMGTEDLPEGTPAADAPATDSILFPSPSELGVRLRKIIASFNRMFANAAREEAKRVLNLANKRKMEAAAAAMKAAGPVAPPKPVPPPKPVKVVVPLTKKDKFGKPSLLII